MVYRNKLLLLFGCQLVQALVTTLHSILLSGPVLSLPKTGGGVPELIPVLSSQPAGDVSHKPGGRLPLLSARPAVSSATLKRAATSFAAW